LTTLNSSISPNDMYDEGGVVATGYHHIGHHLSHMRGMDNGQTSSHPVLMVAATTHE
jgi:hypothetical protein